MEEIFSRTSSFRFPNHLIPRSHPSTSVNARAFQAYFLLFFLFFFISVVSPPLSSHFLDRLEFHHLFSPSLPLLLAPSLVSFRSSPRGNNPRGCRPSGSGDPPLAVSRIDFRWFSTRSIRRIFRQPPRLLVASARSASGFSRAAHAEALRNFFNGAARR